MEQPDSFVGLFSSCFFALQGRPAPAGRQGGFRRGGSQLPLGPLWLWYGAVGPIETAAALGGRLAED